ncbi:hypothetical protein [Paracoccus yeei]|uniref:hypothetical protein n=1 Tax=Paracoccus yeei TaxID=147645 RepID=UPI003BF87D8A
MYLDPPQIVELGKLLKTFFTLPYSTDLDGKDCETLLRIIKGSNESVSKRKELFDIVSGGTGYSVKTLRKSPNATRVDLQEQRFCDVEVLQGLAEGEGNDVAQGKVILSYMRSRIIEEMERRSVASARSLILLKWWDARRENFSFRYWEEDFLGYIDDLWARNEKGEVEWVILPAGVHARDKCRQDATGKNVRLLRMHHKHNQIFTDHDILSDADTITFSAKPLTWQKLSILLGKTE